MTSQAISPVLIGRGLRFAEGINFDRDGTLYCVDLEGGALWRMPPGGILREWLHTGGPNGSRFGPDGDLYVAECGRRAILRIAPATGEQVVVADRCDGVPFNGPNDLCFGPDGTLYFTDPMGSSLAAPSGSVYAVTPDGAVSAVARGIAFPNGLMANPDGSILIVADTYTGLLRRYRLGASHRYQEVEPLVRLQPASQAVAAEDREAGPDGMAFGADGNLYVAHYGAGLVQVVRPDGTLAAGLPAGGPTPTNVAFWDESLYVTEGTSGAIYRLDIGVREQPPFARPW